MADRHSRLPARKECKRDAIIPATALGNHEDPGKNDSGYKPSGANSSAKGRSDDKPGALAFRIPAPTTLLPTQA